MPKGEDSFGTFQVRHSPANRFKCGYCSKNVPTAITYQQLDLGDIKPEYTIAKKTKTFGLECGCYSKFNRQIAHIVTKMEYAAKKRAEEEYSVRA